MIWTDVVGKVPGYVGIQISGCPASRRSEPLGGRGQRLSGRCVRSARPLRARPHRASPRERPRISGHAVRIDEATSWIARVEQRRRSRPRSMIVAHRRWLTTLDAINARRGLRTFESFCRLSRMWPACCGGTNNIRSDRFDGATRGLPKTGHELLTTSPRQQGTGKAAQMRGPQIHPAPARRSM